MKRGRPFEPGNKLGRGRPPGSRNKRTLLGQSLLEQHEGAVVRKALSSALQGDSPMTRALLPYILKRPTDPPPNIGPLPMGTAQELLQSNENVMKALAAGKLTLPQAQVIDTLIETRRRVVETGEMDARIQVLEQLRERERARHVVPEGRGHKRDRQ